MNEAGRILAIDYGTKRIGLALSDPTRLIAQGAGTFANDATFFKKLIALIEREDVTLILVGMPYSPDGGKSKKGIEVDEFIKRVRVHTALAIETWDESFTSVAAHEAFIAIGMKKKKRREKHRVDEMAARLLLQEYLDHHRSTEKE